MAVEIENWGDTAPLSRSRSATHSLPGSSRHTASDRHVTLLDVPAFPVSPRRARRGAVHRSSDTTSRRPRIRCMSSCSLRTKGSVHAIVRLSGAGALAGTGNQNQNRQNQAAAPENPRKDEWRQHHGLKDRPQVGEQSLLSRSPITLMAPVATVQI